MLYRFTFRDTSSKKDPNTIQTGGIDIPDEQDDAMAYAKLFCPWYEVLTLEPAKPMGRPVTIGNVKHLGINLPVKLAEAMEAQALTRGMTRTAWITEAIQHHLEPKAVDKV